MPLGIMIYSMPLGIMICSMPLLGIMIYSMPLGIMICSMPLLGIIIYSMHRHNEASILTFVSRELTSWLASVRSHRVTGITLPPVDATFSLLLRVCPNCEEETTDDRVLREFFSHSNLQESSRQLKKRCKIGYNKCRAVANVVIVTFSNIGTTTCLTCLLHSGNR